VTQERDDATLAYAHRMSEVRLVEVGGGIRLACHEARGGRDVGDPVVLLHGLGDDARTWAPVADAFGGGRAYAVDLRGHGGSDRPGSYSFTLLRDDVVGLLDALGLERVTLVGHSLGAAVALLVAQHQPRRVSTLIVEEPPPLLPADPPRDVPPRPPGPVDLDWAAVEQLIVDRNRPDPAWWAALPGITARTLVLAGGPASHLPQEQVAALAARIPGATLVSVPAGHEIHAAAPAAFRAAVSAFLEES
jgi:3-oxoadipate enol-lactonase